MIARHHSAAWKEPLRRACRVRQHRFAICRCKKTSPLPPATQDAELMGWRVTTGEPVDICLRTGKLNTPLVAVGCNPRIPDLVCAFP
jgi:hypothetical protein